MAMKKCSFCAEEIQEEAVKCKHCGSWLTQTQPSPHQGIKSWTAPRRLKRSATDRMFVGVCGGIANYLNMDPTLVRVAYAIFTVFTAFFPGLVLYVALGFIIPLEGAD